MIVSPWLKPRAMLSRMMNIFVQKDNGSKRKSEEQ